mmetsp:Transcript_22491/g.57329  ORF Transcript_22491/g.57329 Transcript_22491/m.57329 type:complete len:243 (+) Transcript_22491:806-1534(+)
MFARSLSRWRLCSMQVLRISDSKIVPVQSRSSLKTSRTGSFKSSRNCQMSLLALFARMTLPMARMRSSRSCLCCSCVSSRISQASRKLEGWFSRTHASLAPPGLGRPVAGLISVGAPRRRRSEASRPPRDVKWKPTSSCWARTLRTTRIVCSSALSGKDVRSRCTMASASAACLSASARSSLSEQWVCSSVARMAPRGMESTAHRSASACVRAPTPRCCTRARSVSEMVGACGAIISATTLA